ncbi:hypothetical protein [Jannaschia sp. 2305UL9-9]|uniref:hypothetical protein n=1 Tax=Jannaschia sp. 2305UL9-9 TaxID=3121638 RepID=UPI003526E47D
MTGTTAQTSNATKKEQVSETVDTVKERVGAIGDNAKEAASAAAGKARDAASETVTAKSNEAKAAVADRASTTARNLLNAAEQMEPGSPQAEATFRAAKAAEDVAVAIHEKDLNTLTNDVAALARKHPGPFLAVAAVAGFAVGRFLKSSARNSASRYEA